MPGDSCIVCGNTRSKDPGVSLHRFPANETRRVAWLCVFQLQESQVKSHTSVCCRHFPGGDITKDPQTGLGKRFASPKKNDTPRAKSANRKEVTKHWSSLLESPAGHSRSTTPLSKSPDPVRKPLLTANIGEPLDSEYSVHKLPSDSSEPSTSHSVMQYTQVVVNKAIVAQVELQEGRSIAHLRIHVERAIGRIKNFTILTGKLPISMTRIADQIVSVCTFLSNFHPASVPVPVPNDPLESEVEEYFPVTRVTKMVTVNLSMTNTILFQYMCTMESLLRLYT